MLTITIAQVVFLVTSIALGVLILLQQSKGAGMGASFGAGASGTVFGARGAGSFLYKLTRFLAVVFFVTALGLGYLQNEAARGGSILNDSRSEEKKVEAALDVPMQGADNGAPASNADIPGPAQQSQ
ncbi:MAG: preprotein translocase subunit SecG [Cardiobacteriaceae bacterium]|nr:preprotein translocase subunit SecG [Cardiobacteriaceae bacterium]